MFCFCFLKTISNLGIHVEFNHIPDCDNPSNGGRLCLEMSLGGVLFTAWALFTNDNHDVRVNGIRHC